MPLGCLYWKLRPSVLKYITDGLENVQEKKKIFAEIKKATQERKKPCPSAESVDSLMAEMPFANTDIEDEFARK